MKQKIIPLTEFDRDPIKEFLKWRELARQAGNPDVDAMTLATADLQGLPSARVVLYKGVNEEGFVFYTNYMSAKGQQLERNPRAALVFYWPEIYRQVRVEGTVKKCSRADSEAYFKTRPRESQLGAWTSKQSQPIAGYEFLEQRYAEVEKSFEGKEIPCPSYWGGFTVVPEKIEFWVGGTRRLHQRVCFEKNGRIWQMNFLSP